MGYRLSKIYTRTGDDGKTQVEPGKRILKNHLRIEALGTLDELNCVMGIIQGFSSDNDINQLFTEIQHDLFNLGGELCPPHHRVIVKEKTEHLENKIDEWNESLPPLKEFILPRGNLATTHCHLARAVCRRAERVLVALDQVEKVLPESLRYLNRLSDLLFVAARILAKDEKEILWDHQR